MYFVAFRFTVKRLTGHVAYLCGHENDACSLPRGFNPAINHTRMHDAEITADYSPRDSLKTRRANYRPRRPRLGTSARLSRIVEIEKLIDQSTTIGNSATRARLTIRRGYEYVRCRIFGKRCAIRINLKLSIYNRSACPGVVNIFAQRLSANGLHFDVISRRDAIGIIYNSFHNSHYARVFRDCAASFHDLRANIVAARIEIDRSQAKHTSKNNTRGRIDIVIITKKKEKQKRKRKETSDTFDNANVR
jgi:hypothetical protein